MTDPAKEESPRYYYFRAHNHPLGWGVQDSKSESTIAFGDKSICCTVAALLNSDPKGAGLLTGWPKAFDGWAAAGCPTYRYDYETGNLIAKSQTGN